MPQTGRSILLALCLLYPLAPALASEPQQQSPRDVTISIELKSIDRIDSQNQTFRANFYLYASWIDPQLQQRYRNQAGQCYEDKINWETIWKPDFEYINASDKVEPRRYTYEFDKDKGCGTVKYWAHIVATFQNEMALVKFPFDTQIFRIDIESYEHDRKQLRFSSIDKDNNKISDVMAAPSILCSVDFEDKTCAYFPEKEFINSMPEWDYKEFTILLGQHAYAKEATQYSRVSFDIKLARKSGFYIWKVMVPLLLIASLSWLIFLADINDYLKRLGSSFTLFLSSVTFSLFTKSILPAISYLVLIDYYTFGTYFMIFISALVSTIVYRLTLKAKNTGNVHYQDQAAAINRWSLRIFPSAYFVYGIIFTSIILLQ